MKRTNIRSAFFVLTVALSSLAWLGAPSALAQREHCGPGGCWIEIGSTQLPQSVEVQSSKGDFRAVFQSQLKVFPDREASGFLQLIRVRGEAPNPDDEVLVLFENGNVRFERDGSVAGVVLHGRTAEGRRVIVMITPDASEDCLIYTTVGSDVHATWEVPGRITVIRR